MDACINTRIGYTNWKRPEDITGLMNYIPFVLISIYKESNTPIKNISLKFLSLKL